MTLLDQAVDDLRAEFARDGQIDRFEVLKSVLTGDRVPYTELAGRLNIIVGAVQAAVHRLRSRDRDALCARIAATVESPALIDDEIRDLIAVTLVNGRPPS